MTTAVGALVLIVILLALALLKSVMNNSDLKAERDRYSNLYDSAQRNEERIRTDRGVYCERLADANRIITKLVQENGKAHGKGKVQLTYTDALDSEVRAVMLVRNANTRK